MTGYESPGYTAFEYAEEDWGALHAAADRADAAEGEGYALAETRLDDEALEDWPEPAAPEPQGDLARSRATLIAAPGQARRLSFVFDDRASAARIAESFAEGDPADVVPGSDGYFDTAVEKHAGRWRVAARYVPPTFYPDAETWMVEWLAPTIRRPMKAGVCWCPQWWRHPEALARLDSLWRAWEASRAGGGEAMSLWWITHFEGHWASLTSERGPFAACKDGTHTDRLDALAADSTPEDWEWHPLYITP